MDPNVLDFFSKWMHPGWMEGWWCKKRSKCHTQNSMGWMRPRPGNLATNLMEGIDEGGDDKDVLPEKIRLTTSWGWEVNAMIYWVYLSQVMQYFFHQIIWCNDIFRVDLVIDMAWCYMRCSNDLARLTTALDEAGVELKKIGPDMSFAAKEILREAVTLPLRMARELREMSGGYLV